jgi:integrase
MASKYDERGLLPGFFRKRDVIYVHLKGKNYSCGTDKITEAVAFKNRLKLEIDELKAEGVTQAKNMTGLFEAYLEHLKRKEEDGGTYAQTGMTTSYRTASVIRCHLEPFFGQMTPEDVRYKLNDYRDARRNEGGKPTTMNGEFRILSATLNRAWKDGKLSRNALPPEYPFNNKAERKAVRKGTITDQQRDAILAQAAPYLQIVFRTALATGCRPKEIRFLRDEQVVLDDAKPRFELRTGETKNGDGRVVAINDDLKEHLIAWREQTQIEHPSCPWFFHYCGKQLGDFGKAWDTALLRCGLRVKGSDGRMKNKVLFYDARRTARTQMDEAGVSQEDAKLVMGHKTDGMSTRYNQSLKGVDRIRDAQNARLKAKGREAGAIAPAACVGLLDGLRELAGMFKDGMLTKEEFAGIKAKLIGD